MGRSGDRICSIEGFELGYDLPEAMGNALRSFTRRGTLLIRLTTVSGQVGWGETWAFARPAASLIREGLAPLVLGAASDAPRRLSAEMMRRVVPDRRGLANMAVSALDIALWDLFARSEAQPLHAVLGGALRDRLPAYASGPLLPEGADRYRDLDAEVQDYIDAGFAAVKIRAGLSPAEDEPAMRRVRKILGPDRRFMVDLNEGSTERDTLSLARRTEDLDLAWIEEPVRHDNLPAYRSLAARLPVALAGGESFFGLPAFRDPVAERTLDIVQPDLALCGGVTEMLGVAGLTEAFDLPLIPHVWGSAVNFLASMQIAAVLRQPAGSDLPLLECDMAYNPLRDRIFPARPERDGTIPLPDGAGLGVEIDIDRLSDFVIDHWTVT